MLDEQLVSSPKFQTTILMVAKMTGLALSINSRVPTDPSMFWDFPGLNFYALGAHFYEFLGTVARMT